MKRWMVGFFAAGAALLVTSAVAALDPGARAPAFDGRALANAQRIDLAQQGRARGLLGFVV